MEYLQSCLNALWSMLPLSGAGATMFAAVLAGVGIGTVFGVIPGIGGLTAMILAIPFLYSADPVLALVFLVALNAVGATGGDVTSVLFGIPGEATSAATVVDGHPLTLSGEAGRAVFAAVASSLVGAIFGAVILAAAIPLVEPLVLSVASAEQFMLVLFALTYIAALSRGNFAAGLLAGGVGLLLSTAGMDPVTAVPRLTFETLLGREYANMLLDGVSLIAVSMGLFSVPALVDIMARTPMRSAVPALGRYLRAGFSDLARHFWLIIRSSAIGTYIGLLPGVGGSVAQWVAYAHAARGKPVGKPFGEGAIEGVIAPGAANNAKEGGSLVPTLAFGVPGSVSTTILLSAFLLFGVTPGVAMLDPAQHLELTYSFVWAIVIGNVLAVVLIVIGLPVLVRLAHAPARWVAPFLALFLVVGAYAVRGSVFDLVLVLAFGAIGLLMRRHHWPRPPLLLGLVLGHIAESSLHITMNAYGWSWLARPGVLLIAALMAAAVLRRLMRPAGERS